MLLKCDERLMDYFSWMKLFMLSLINLDVIENILEVKRCLHTFSFMQRRYQLSGIHNKINNGIIIFMGSRHI